MKDAVLNKLTSLLFYISILFFIIGFNFSDNPLTGGWYQQMMSDIGGRQITDIYFIDSITGWAVTNATNQYYDSAYILKTINGGDNWSIQYKKPQQGGGYFGLSKIKFINYNTGFISGARVYKTTDGGDSWSNIYNLGQIVLNDMGVLNNDTIWVVNSNSLEGGVFRTTNGGQSWTQQLALGSQNPNHIYFYNARLGFIARDNQYLRRTTDAGQTWSLVNGAGGFWDMQFADSLTGWKTSVQKTTDGGLTWINQVLPSGGNILSSAMVSISAVNKDTLWGVGGYLYFPNSNIVRGMIYRTTNGGANWRFQVPDTSINIAVYSFIDFINKNNGWAYTGSPGIHTITGGDTVFLTGLENIISTKVPNEFLLYQNYPNPFNPVTNIIFSVREASNVKLIVYDIAGREVEILINDKLTKGEYKTDFTAKYLSSGIYFYSLYADGKLIDTKKMVLIK